MVEVVIVVREFGRKKPDYSLKFELPTLPRPGDYISIKKQWRKANAERALARGREDSAKFRKSNPESVRASQRKWNAANKEYKRQADRDRYEREKEKRKAARRARYAARKAMAVIERHAATLSL
ncbi:MAG: hypothetical protein HXY28_04015 [Hydrogenophilaceae bacterium]|jgi:hypothetical protein|nr:hypothetical protein [Hydrogenophilaceae bacterium]